MLNSKRLLRRGGSPPSPVFLLPDFFQLFCFWAIFSQQFVLQQFTHLLSGIITIQSLAATLLNLDCQATGNMF